MKTNIYTILRDAINQFYGLSRSGELTITIITPTGEYDKITEIDVQDYHNRETHRKDRNIRIKVDKL